MKFENTEVWGFEHALRGMRNPMNSWDKSDSFDCDDADMGIDGSYCRNCPLKKNCLDIKDRFVIGENDMKLAQSLIKAGSEHRKFMRQIFVSVDITAPLYWWKELDTYKVGTVANSTSTMHKLASTPITMDCFEMDYFNKDLDFFYDSGREVYKSYWKRQIEWLEGMRLTYLDSKDKRHWNELIRALPESWLQKRTITMNYENVLNMVHQRRIHKLSEWSESFINWAKSLPYADELLFIKKEVKK